MTRRNNKNRQKDLQVQLRIENLESRELMTASPVYGPLPDSVPSQEMTAPVNRMILNTGLVAKSDLSRIASRPSFGVGVTQENDIIKISGTSNDDFVEVSRPDAQHVKVTVYKDQDRTQVRSSSTFKRSAVKAIHFDGKAGNDFLWNGHQGETTVEIPTVGSITIAGTVEQHDLPVIGQGGSGNDLLEGGNATDLLHGNDGNDTLRGNRGNDLLFGDSGHDNLYGGAGADDLYGGDGRDGLFGGKDLDYLHGGGDADRFLVEKDGDSIGDKSSTDASIYFENGKKKTGSIKNVSVGEDTFKKLKYTLAPGKWSNQDIERVDQALQSLHHLTGNTNFLKRHNGKEMTFVKLGKQTVVDQEGNEVSTAAVGGFNSGKRIGLTSIIFENRKHDPNDDVLVQTIFHEIGHNWDQASENSRTKEFRELSEWKGKTHDDSAEFARPYGETNAKEDYATVFAAYMMDQDDRNYNGLSDSDHDDLMAKIADKLDVVDDLVKALS